MSVRGGVGTRLYVAGGQEVRTEFDRTGQHAQRMWSEIGSGQRTASPALRAVSSAAEGAKEAVEGMAAGAGGLGRSLAVLGPAGIAAGAALGGLLMAIQNSRATAEWADELATTADLVGINAEKLQELRHAGEVFEVGVADLDRGLQNLNAALGAMRTGVGDGRLKEAFAELGITPDQLATMESADQLLPVLADKFVALGSRADQTQLAKKLQIEDLLPLLIQGSANIEEMTDKARELGLVMDEASVQGAAAMNEELRVADERLSAAARSMQVEMVPALVAMKNALADAAQGAADLFNWLNRASMSNLDRQIQQQQNVARQSRGRAEILRDEKSSYLDVVGTGAVTPLEARSREARLAAARRQDAAADRAEAIIQDLALAEERRLKELATEEFRRTFVPQPKGAAGADGTNPGRASRPSGQGQVTVTSPDPVDILDLSTGRPIKPKSDQERELEGAVARLFRDRKDLVVPMRVNLLPTLQENLSEYQRDFQDRTQMAFADGLRAAMDGNLGAWMSNRLREMLFEDVAEGAAEALGALRKGAGDGLWGSVLDFGVDFFGRRAAGGPVQAGRAYSMAEYGGAELAVFGANGQVFDHTATQRMLEKIAAPQASGPAVTLHMSTTIDARGAGPREVEMLSARLDQMDREQPARIVQVVNEGLARRMIRG